MPPSPDPGGQSGAEGSCAVGTPVELESLDQPVEGGLDPRAVLALAEGTHHLVLSWRGSQMPRGAQTPDTTLSLSVRYGGRAETQKSCGTAVGLDVEVVLDDEADLFDGTYDATLWARGNDRARLWVDLSEAALHDALVLPSTDLPIDEVGIRVIFAGSSPARGEVEVRGNRDDDYISCVAARLSADDRCDIDDRRLETGETVHGVAPREMVETVLNKIAPLPPIPLTDWESREDTSAVVTTLHATIGLADGPTCAYAVNLGWDVVGHGRLRVDVPLEVQLQSEDGQIDIRVAGRSDVEFTDGGAWSRITYKLDATAAEGRFDPQDWLPGFDPAAGDAVVVTGSIRPIIDGDWKLERVNAGFTFEPVGPQPSSLSVLHHDWSGEAACLGVAGNAVRLMTHDP